jgi:hypothetical protein
MRHALALLVGSALLSVAASAGAAETDAADWPGRVGRYVFEVARDGKPIGTQEIEIRRDGDTVTASTESTIAVKMLGIVVYRMHQVLVETYQGGRLVALHAETRDPEGLRVGDITRDGDHWTGKLGKQHRAFDCDCITSTMWQSAGLAGPSIIEASQARLRSITVVDKGAETLDLPEGAVVTRHLTVKGEIEREVWYDSTGNLVAAEQVGSDGSLIRQTLMSDPTASRENRAEASEP